MKIRKIYELLLRVSLFVRKLNVNIRIACVDYNLNYTFSLTNQWAPVPPTEKENFPFI